MLASLLSRQVYFSLPLRWEGAVFSALRRSFVSAPLSSSPAGGSSSLGVSFTQKLRPPPGREPRSFASASFRGPVQDHIEERLLKSVLAPLHLEVANESHGRASDESHFHVFVVSEAFEGLRPIARHRLVSQLFVGEDGNLKFHSLRITAKTPAMWEKDQSAPVAPKCSGKGDGRAPTDVTSL
ncbi:unnamed protein product [Polarella glacialis]|uniref:BolA family protein n=1 Tax=Polarella glacialis TaxID=89957 RepID=A0A813H139_POLGL|nr:unnamed protein product [Polarella glacialis]CAE8679510.1 unnamed protein product [Polarella glacialis]